MSQLLRRAAELAASDDMTEEQFKLAAATQFSLTMLERRADESDRCPVCGGLRAGDITHTRC